MSTNSTISIIRKDQSASLIYVHSGGNICVNGFQLFLYYQDPKKLEELISLGNLSILGKNIHPKTTNHNFNNIESKTCLFYSRDRGEDLSVQHFSSEKKLISFIKHNYKYDYNYIYNENNDISWSVLKESKKSDLKTLVQEDYNKINNIINEDILFDYKKYLTSELYKELKNEIEPTSQISNKIKI